MSDFVFSHKPVMLRECIDNLNIRDGMTYVDCTTGGGGHSFEIASRLGGAGRLICIDQDECALRAARARLAPFSNRITFVHDNFSELGRILDEHSIDNLGGVLMDLGCSSYQLDTPERGFSYNNDAPLNMKMNEDRLLDARQVVNTYSEEELRRIIFEYGEERFAPRIAQSIVRHRAEREIETTGELTKIILGAIPSSARDGGHHPAKRTFQAIRIEVNAELDVITPAINAAAEAMIPGGRIAAISFHSLEDRKVKESFATLSSGCTCPRDFPVCICGNKPKIKTVTRKPILPSAAETEENPRARSAKLRVAEVLAR